MTQVALQQAVTGEEFRTEQSSPEWRSVPPEHAYVAWSQLLPMIKRGISHGQGDGTTAEAMLGQVLLGKFKMWVVTEDDRVIAGIVFSVREMVTGTKIFVELLAGSGMDDWGDELETALLKLKELTGAYAIEGSCRPGLARYLSRRGWRKKATIMEL